MQAPVFMALLPKLHMNRHTACSIIFGPTQFGGLAMPSLYGMQIYGQL
jgi:nucleoside-specific outer membrane channel protein Tsx